MSIITLVLLVIALHVGHNILLRAIIVDNMKISVTTINFKNNVPLILFR